jgi:hypothetical protein
LCPAAFFLGPCKIDKFTPQGTKHREGLPNKTLKKETETYPRWFRWSSARTSLGKTEKEKKKRKINSLQPKPTPKYPRAHEKQK